MLVGIYQRARLGRYDRTASMKHDEESMDPAKPPVLGLQAFTMKLVVRRGEPPSVFVGSALVAHDF